MPRVNSPQSHRLQTRFAQNYCFPMPENDIKHAATVPLSESSYLFTGFLQNGYGVIFQKENWESFDL